MSSLNEGRRTQSEREDNSSVCNLSNQRKTTLYRCTIVLYLPRPGIGVSSSGSESILCKGLRVIGARTAALNAHPAVNKLV